MVCLLANVLVYLFGCGLFFFFSDLSNNLSTQEERERQITMVRERIARVRYERTMTMKEPKEDKGQGFENLLTEEEKHGLSEEDKMKRIAAKMEEKFKSETRRVSTIAAVSIQSFLVVNEVFLWWTYTKDKDWNLSPVVSHLWL